MNNFFNNIKKKILDNSYNKIVTVILLFTIFIPTFILLTTVSSSRVKADWIVGSEWQYRIPISIASHSSLESNVYVTVPSFDGTDSTRYQSDCGDLRFTKLNGDILQYYIVDCDATAEIHVLFDTLPTGVNHFWMYYGNSSATDGFEILDFTMPATGLGAINFGLEEFRANPIAYWNFDEGSGNTLVDAFGGNTATLGPNASVTSEDPTWTTGVNCFKDSCLQFDNSNDYVDAGSPSAFNFGTGNFSISLWANINSSAQVQRLVERSATGAAVGQWGFFIATDRSLSFVSQSIQQITSTCIVPTNQWVNLTISRTATTLRFWMNGSLCSSHTITSVNYNTTVPLRIGGNIITGANGVINGKLDEIKIWNRVLTDQEVTDNYILDKEFEFNGNMFGVQDDTNRLPIPIIHYKLDEQTGQVINNSISNSYPGTLGANSSAASDDPVWQNPDNCRVNGCQTFNASQYNDIGNIGDLSTTYSASVWLKPSTTTGSPIMLSYRTDNQATSNSVGFQLDQNGADLRFIVRNTAGTGMFATASNVLTVGQWVHVMGVRNGNTTKIYVNGILMQTLSTSVNAVPMNRMVIGAFFNDLTNTIDSLYRYQGSLDEIKVWNVALTDDQVKLDYNYNSALNVGVTSNTEASSLVGGAGNPPISEWKFDENQGSVANDTSINNNNFTLNSDTKWIPGKVGSALQFDGIDDNATVASSTALNIGTSDFTIEAWVKGRSIENSDIIIGKTTGGGCSSTYGYSLGVFDSLYPTIHFCTTTGSHAKIQGQQSLVDGQWYHIVVVVDRDSTTNTRMYINGIPVTTTTANLTSHTGAITNTEVLALGSESDGGFYWDGALDQIRIYNYLRTTPQIAYSFNRGGPVGWWRLDQTSGTTALDYSGFANDGTLINMDPSTDWLNDISCRLGKCLDFDGSNDYITIPSTPRYHVGNSFSASAWVYVKSYPLGPPDYADFIMVRGDDQVAGTFMLGYRAGGVPFFAVRHTGGSGANRTWEASGGSIPLNTWVHIAGTHEGNAVKLYINGVLIQTINSSSVPNMPTINEPLWIGANNNPSYRYQLNGRVDDARLYNYPLSAQQIQQIYNIDSALRYE